MRNHNKNHDHSNQTNQKRSEARPAEARPAEIRSEEARSEGLGDPSTDAVAGSETKSEKSQMSVSDMFGENFSSADKDRIDRIVREAQEFAVQARTYVRQNPAEVVGLIATGAGVLWALFRTKPGRFILDAGTGYAMPLASNWVSQFVTKRDFASSLR